jgi:hypothetical protein
MPSFTDQPIYIHRGSGFFQKNLVVDRLLDEGGMPIEELVKVIPSWQAKPEEIAQFFDLVGYNQDGTPSGKEPANSVVAFLLTGPGLDMNALARHMYQTKAPQDHIDQFYQLIGYGVDGYEEVQLVSDAAKDRAYEALEALISTRH